MSELVKPFTVKELGIPKTEHATFGGSSAYVWLNCTGWYDLIQALPSTDSPGMTRAANEGSACHTVMEELVLAHTPPEKRFGGPSALPEKYSTPALQPENFLGCKLTFEYQPKTPPVVLDPDHIHNISLCFDELQPILRAASLVFIERKVYASADFGEHAFGYVDLACLIRLHTGKYRLVVIDYKFGFVRVNVETEQLQYYAAGITKSILDLMAKRQEVDFELVEVECIILQPKAEPDHFSSIVYTTAELLAFVKRAEGAIFAAMSGHGKLSAGGHCKYCKAAKICPELRDQLTNFPSDAPLVPHDPTSDNLAELMRKAHLARIAASRVEAYCFDMVRQGATIPGYKVVQTKNSTAWKGGRKVALRKLGALGYTEAQVSKQVLMTPRELGLAHVNLDLTPLVERDIQFALAPTKDRRPAVAPSGPEALFPPDEDSEQDVEE